MPSRTRPSRRLLATLLLLAPAALAAQSAPKTGLDVLKRMHDAYATTWYHTLTAVRKTKSYGPGDRSPLNPPPHWTMPGRRLT